VPDLPKQRTLRESVAYIEGFEAGWKAVMEVVLKTRDELEQQTAKVRLLIDREMRRSGA
jgi:hypothetical protein